MWDLNYVAKQHGLTRDKKDVSFLKYYTLYNNSEKNGHMMSSILLLLQYTTPTDWTDLFKWLGLWPMLFS